MKRVIALALLLAVALITTFPKTYDSPLAMTERVRKEINQADADTIAITWVAGILQDDRMLFWCYTGNEYQAHVYYPVECRVHGTWPEITYEFVKIYNPTDNIEDIAALQWKGTYVFCINNPDCHTFEIKGAAGDHTITLDRPDDYPHVFQYPGQPSEWHFYDAEGNEIR